MPTSYVDADDATAQRRVRTAEIMAVGFAALQDWVVHRRTPPAWYVPANVACALAGVAVGRWGGASSRELGVARADVGTGVRDGMLAAGVVAAGVTAAAAHPRGRRWFADDRYVSMSAGRVLYETVVRIPVGTALAEELVFRGALLGLSVRQRSWPVSVARTAVLFGLWHLVPALGRRRASGGRVSAGAAVAGEVVTTAGAGVVLAVLRGRSGSVVAPTLLHATTNAAALIAARALPRRRTRPAMRSAPIRPAGGAPAV